MREVAVVMSVPRLVATLVALSLISSVVRAQEVVEKSFATQLFEPAIGVDTVFVVEGPEVADHLAFGTGVMFNYQYKPLVVTVDTAKPGSATQGGGLVRTIPLVENQATVNVVGALGFHHRWLRAQVGIDLPINLRLTGNDINPVSMESAGTYGTTGLGDLRLQLKMMLLRKVGDIFSLAFSPEITFPTSVPQDSYSGGGFTFRPRLVGGVRLGKFWIAANLGVLFRTQKAVVFSAEVGHQLLYSLGAGFQAHRRVAVLAELFGRAGFSTDADCSTDPATGERICTGSSASDADAFPLELGAGTRIEVTRGLDLNIGAGFGLTAAIGSPAFRIFSGIQWSPNFRDTDDDRIYDYKDLCPTQSEDRDGYQDDDGCPDPDNDGDLIPDPRDRCPDQPEDKDGFEDDDGCPDPDNDKDGIIDLKDACPFKPETKNGYMDQDGCPDVPDQDGDGIADDKDKCPKEAEDKDGFEDDDGCPDVDNDMDEVPDQFDDCPNEPEDMDQDRDDDGCPDE
jgi:hypothetical protein